MRIALKQKLVISAITVIALWITPEVRAGTIIQEEHAQRFQIFIHSPIGQTFTAEDSKIKSIGFYVEDINPGEMELSIQLYEGIGTGGTYLDSSPVEGLYPGFKGVFDADFSSVTLTVGQTYTAIISAPSARGVVGATQWATFEGRQLIPDLYVGGDMIFIGQVLNYYDCAFRVVPEPATLLLLGLGAMVLRKRI